MLSISIFIASVLQIGYTAQIEQPVGQPGDIPKSTSLNGWVRRADAIIVGRFRAHNPESGLSDYYDTNSLEDAPGDPPTLRVFRHRFDVVLNVVGQTPQTVVVLEDATLTPHYHGMFIGDGELYLLFLYRPGPNNRIRIAGSASGFFAESQSQYYIGTPQGVSLNEGTYTVIGQTHVEKYVGIIYQSYLHGPSRSGTGTIGAVAPEGRWEEGQWVCRPGMDGPGWMDFYTNTIEPGLLQVAGDDKRLKLAVLGCSVRSGRIQRISEWKALIAEIDATWPDLDDWGLPFNLRSYDEDPMYLISLFTARLPALRSEAVEKLPVNIAQKDYVIQLLYDPHNRVRYHAIQWLYRLQIPGAPQPKWGGGYTVENEQEIIQYWTGAHHVGQQR
jgi:hypothetical protein